MYFTESFLYNKKEKLLQKHKLFLISIIIIAFAVRVIFCFFVAKLHIQRDTVDYIQQADILLQGGYKNYFPNGYPLIIAYTKIITGKYFISMLLWLNILLSVVSVYFSFDITKSVTGNTITALIAAALLAVFPTQINYVRWVLSEAPSTFLLLGFFFFYLRKQNWWAGIFIGIATVVRTELLLVLPFVMFIEFVCFRKIRFGLIGGLLIPVLLIGFYCYQKTGIFSLSGHGKVNLLYSITSSGSYVDWMYHTKHPEIKTSGQAMEMYIEYMKENPIQYLKNRAANFWELWGLFPSSSQGNRKLEARLFIGATNFFLLTFGFLGWWKVRRNFFAAILIVPFIIVTVVHTLLLALPRYTYTAEPFMIILGSIILYKMFDKTIPQKVL